MRRSSNNSLATCAEYLAEYCASSYLRFVFGLTLGPDMMTVWMHDRSGVIGTKTAINIHKVGEISILLLRMGY